MRVADTAKRGEPDADMLGSAERASWVLELSAAAVNSLAELLVVVALSALILIIIVGIFFRYALNDSLVWTEELARYLFVWVTFLGGGLGVGRNIHVGVDSAMRLLPHKVRQWTELLVEIAIAVFVVTLISIGIQYTAFGMNAEALLIPVPMGCVYLAVPCGGAVMLVNVLVNIARHLGAVLQGGSAPR